MSYKANKVTIGVWARNEVTFRLQTDANLD